ncbi:MAG: hypothetical protein LBC75_02560 [Fibromonadaceae bacterium]|jgi:hypothetical protein|nr:hypothetical protein [Fibromonadaceae bacterium]
MAKIKLTPDSAVVKLTGILNTLDYLSSQASDVVAEQLVCEDKTDLDVIKQNLATVRANIKSADMTIKRTSIRIPDGYVDSFKEYQEQKGFMDNEVMSDLEFSKGKIE